MSFVLRTLNTIIPLVFNTQQSKPYDCKRSACVRRRRRGACAASQVCYWQTLYTNLRFLVFSTHGADQISRATSPHLENMLREFISPLTRRCQDFKMGGTRIIVFVITLQLTFNSF